MPGKHKRGRNRANKKTSATPNVLPMVSVCTPTFNRRPFIPYMIRCFRHQDYPMDRIEWIIVDDGTDPIEDLIDAANIPNVKYYKLGKKIPLGKKRNLMHSYTCGDIIVYMDDDDYYPPCRISHAVETLQKNPDALCAGSSILHIYFKHLQKVYEFGPYGPRHATAGTFAFRKELLDITAYDDNAAIGEEKVFLKNYTVPFVQLVPMKVILVFSHEHNTFDKRKLLTGASPALVKPTSIHPSAFVKEPDLLQFYMNDVDDRLSEYAPGRPEMKPDVLENIKKLEKERAEQTQRITMKVGNEPPRPFAGEEIASILNSKQMEINKLKRLLEAKSRENHLLQVQIHNAADRGW